MNGKRAKKLRKMAVDMASGIASGAGKGILDAKPFEIYKELKKIEKKYGSKQPKP